MKINFTDGKVLVINKHSSLEREYKLKDCTIFQFKNDIYLTIDNNNNFEDCKDCPF